ncbi:MAG TPA: hypothetical protein VGC80_01065, partial [Acetobacteraceae bacterium]
FSPSQRRSFVQFATGRAKSPRGNPTFEEQLDSTQIIAGTPDQVIPKLKYIMEQTRPGIMAFWANDGSVSPEDTRTCIRLLGQEVMPALREYGAQLGLDSPFECDAPVSLAYSTDLKAAAE